MNRKFKIFLIVLGYFIVFILTFVFMGGLEALLLLASEISETLEDAIMNLISIFKEVIP